MAGVDILTLPVAFMIHGYLCFVRREQSCVLIQFQEAHKSTRVDISVSYYQRSHPSEAYSQSRALPLVVWSAEAVRRSLIISMTHLALSSELHRGCGLSPVVPPPPLFLSPNMRQVQGSDHGAR